MEEIINFIGNVGFPIVVTVFLLARVESKLDGLSESITELSIAIKDLK